MISFALNHISWFMVVAAAAIGFIVGMLWYSPMLFGNTWMRLSGIMVDPAANIGFYLANEFVGLLLQAYTLAWILERTNALGLVDAILVASMLSFCLIGVNQWCGVMWSRRPRELFLVYQGATLMTFLSMALVFVYVAV